MAILEYRDNVREIDSSARRSVQLIATLLQCIVSGIKQKEIVQILGELVTEISDPISKHPLLHKNIVETLAVLYSDEKTQHAVDAVTMIYQKVRIFIFEGNAIIQSIKDKSDRLDQHQTLTDTEVLLLIDKVTSYATQIAGFHGFSNNP